MLAFFNIGEGGQNCYDGEKNDCARRLGLPISKQILFARFKVMLWSTKCGCHTEYSAIPYFQYFRCLWEPWSWWTWRQAPSAGTREQNNTYIEIKFIRGSYSIHWMKSFKRKLCQLNQSYHKNTNQSFKNNFRFHFWKFNYIIIDLFTHRLRTRAY